MKTADFLAAAPDWRIVSDGAVAYYPTGSLAASARFVHALAGLMASASISSPSTSAATA